MAGPSFLKARTEQKTGEYSANAMKQAAADLASFAEQCNRTGRELTQVMQSRYGNSAG